MHFKEVSHHYLRFREAAGPEGGGRLGEGHWQLSRWAPGSWGPAAPERAEGSTRCGKGDRMLSKSRAWLCGGEWCHVGSGDSGLLSQEPALARAAWGSPKQGSVAVPRPVPAHLAIPKAEPREASQLVWSKGFSDGDRGLPWALEVSYGSVKVCVCVAGSWILGSQASSVVSRQRLRPSPHAPRHPRKLTRVKARKVMT